MATSFYKPLSCFEPSFERFATVSQDGRLKIFDTRSGGVQQQLAEKDHLSTQYTAIAWGATTVRAHPTTKTAHPSLSGDYLDINFEIFFFPLFLILEFKHCVMLTPLLCLALLSSRASVRPSAASVPRSSSVRFPPKDG
jgi:hypothetical protein